MAGEDFSATATDHLVSTADEDVTEGLTAGVLSES